jgi:outer membrane receptor protein involved in Fe transport
MIFETTQNGLKLDENNLMSHDWDYYNYRIGTDFYISDQHIIGFLVGGREGSGINRINNSIAIYDQETPTALDSILFADSEANNIRKNQTYNLNYRFDNKKGRSLNIDLDYGHYANDSERDQSNQYFNTLDKEELLQGSNTIFNTPSDIDIYTFKVDFEEELLGGKLGLGTKLSKVVSDNTFLVNDDVDGTLIQDNSRSNIFKYDENVYAGYVSYARPLGKKWNFIAGLRAEQTDAMGNLQAFGNGPEADPVTPNYLSWFPNAGLTWQVAPQHSLALNYGRRINRPDYSVLNPFNNQLSELSYQKGNPFLRPEIVNNVELGYTLAYRYNFKLAYSKTTDQITRLIGPDENDDRANFITWANLASQTVTSMNISAPVQLTEFWNAYFNLSAAHQNNQADYGEGAVVDVKVFTYSIYQQHTFDLFKKLKGEISGYYSGPGVWGGVFKYEANWSMDAGLQRKFLKDKMNVKVSVSDIFKTAGWNGVSVFDGLVSAGGGRWDSRRINLSVSYNFGNENVKSRKRKTGMEDEAGRIGDGN